MLNNEIKKYKENQDLIKNYGYALFVMSFDEATDCPKKGKEYSLDVQNFFQQKLINITTSDDYKNNVFYLYEHKDELDAFLRMQIEREYKELDKLLRVPKDELFAHFDNLNRSQMEWREGRETLDFSGFEKELEELIAYLKKYVKWMPVSFDEDYDVLLDECEDNFIVKKYDEFFNLLKEEIVPLCQKIIPLDKKYNKKLDELKFDIPTQRKLTKLILDKMEYTDEVGCIRETIHPFTNGAHANDVRITTSYSESQLFSNLYSVMHEAGHALYELGQDEKLNGTNLFGGTSMALHESQSRFYENYLGRSKSFVKFLTPILKDLFKEELNDITEDDIFYYVNDVSNQLKRTEADELTYSVHILIRYEIEKKLFRNEISVSEIDNEFNKLFETYLGNRPKDKKEGCFQDVHWTSTFGYFPTYALGNAIAAQMYYKMQEELDLDALMEKGNFGPINVWLRQNVHQYGKTKKNEEIIRIASGNDFDPKYYVKYLKDKFTKIYNI